MCLDFNIPSASHRGKEWTEKKKEEERKNIKRGDVTCGREMSDMGTETTAQQTTPNAQL